MKLTDNISELDEEKDSEKIFYKSRWIKEDGLEQHLIVTYSLKYRDYLRTIRSRQLERALKAVKKGAAGVESKRQNDPKVCEYAIPVYCDEVQYPVEAMSAKIAQLSLIYALTTALSSLNREDTLQRAKRTRELINSIRMEEI